MSPEQINELFEAEIKKRGLASKITTITKAVLYNWRQGRSEATLGQKIEVLYFLGKIKIKKNNESD